MCRSHGAASPQAKAAAERRLAEQTAAQAVATFGLPQDIHPLDALEQELRRTAGAVAYLEGLVRSLDDTQLGQSTRNSGRVPSIWVALYQTERKHLLDVSATCIRVGLEERRVKIAEEQGQAVAEVLRRTLIDLGHDPGDEAVRGIVRRHLMAVG